MYEIEDYEDHISKHRKILWLFSLVIFLGYLFCAGYAYNGAKTTDGEQLRANDWRYAHDMRTSTRAARGDLACPSTLTLT